MPVAALIGGLSWFFCYRDQSDLPYIHNGSPSFSLGFEFHLVAVRSWQMYFSDNAWNEMLEMAGFLNEKLEGRVMNLEFYLTSTMPLAATLKQFHTVKARAEQFKLPRRVIQLVDPIAEGVFVRLRFILEFCAMGGGIAGMEQDGSVGQLSDRFAVLGRSQYNMAEGDLFLRASIYLEGPLNLTTCRYLDLAKRKGLRQ